MVDLKALKNAFGKINNIGKGEFSMDVDGVQVWLRALTPEEDVAVQRYARGDGDIESVENMVLIERFKRATLGYSIVQVGDLNLRGINSIPTGEMLDNGVPVRISKFEAVRNITADWSRHATTLLFEGYAELVKRIEDDVNQRVKFDGAKIDAEIERLESRITDLKRLQVASTKVESAPLVDAVLTTEQNMANTAIHPPPAPDGARTRIMPESAPPPPPRVPAPPPPAQQPVQQPVMHSMGDATDEAIRAEENRIMEARAKVAKEHAPDAIPTRPVSRPPPHIAAARHTAETIVDGASDAGAINGIPVYRTTPVNLSDRNASPPAPVRNARTGIDQPPSNKPTNPNFAPRK